MIKIKKNMKILQDTVKIIENINPEIDFVFCPEGIIVKAVDPASISIGIFKIKKELFEEYNVEDTRVCTFQVAMISKILKKVGTKELTISFEEDKVNFITSKDAFSLKFFVGTEDDRPEPEVEGASQWTINTKEFFNLIKEFGDFNEIINCESKDGALYLGTKSSIVEGKSVTESTPLVTEDCSCWYTLPNFLMVANIKNIFDEIKFDFGPDTPCMLTADNDDIRFKWVLAPRVGE